MKRILLYGVAISFLLQSGFVDAEQPPAPDQPAVQNQTRMEQNCRAEGEGEGLSGPALDEFVADCIRELQNLKYPNKVRL